MKLHIGGTEIKDDWKILNIHQAPGVDFVGDISDLSMFEDGSVSEIYASHVFEHVKQSKIIDTLTGIRRTLKSGGRLYIAIPDLDVLCYAFITRMDREEKVEIMRMMFGGQVNDYDFHFFGLNQFLLFDLLGVVGFTEYHRVESFGIFNDTSDYRPYGLPMSLNVIATK
jgi:predicted SAM-dependent methyltransferase